MAGLAVITEACIDVKDRACVTACPVQCIYEFDAVNNVLFSEDEPGSGSIEKAVSAHDGRVLRRLNFPRLVSLVNPSLVPGDSAVVFTAQDYSGRSDLYRATWNVASHRRAGPRGPRRLEWPRYRRHRLGCRT